MQGQEALTLETKGPAMWIVLRQWALLLGLLVGGCAAVPSASPPDRQAVYGYDGHCIVAASQARAIYTTTESLSRRIDDECLAPSAPLSEVYKAFGYDANR
jgi:hypothetical protein